MTIVSLLGCGLAFYAVAGMGVGLAFAVASAGQVLPGSSFNCGACLMFPPSAAALWPHVRFRWLSSRGTPASIRVAENAA